MVICPFRLLERRKIFVDCLHLLSHEPGHELHVVPEVAVPGGSVDYFLTSVDAGKVVDFVGVELQTMDTTGSVWPAREKWSLHPQLGVQTEHGRGWGGYVLGVEGRAEDGDGQDSRAAGTQALAADAVAGCLMRKQLAVAPPGHSAAPLSAMTSRNS